MEESTKSRRAVTDLHHSRGRDFIVVLIRTVVRDLAVFMLTIRTPLALQTLRLELFFCDSLLANDTVWDVSLPNFAENRVARDFVLTLHAGSSRKGSVALYNFLREYPCVCFNIINILCVVGQQFSLVLKKPNEPMGRRPFLFRRKDILRNRKEDARILPEDMDIEDFLRITEAQMRQF